MQLAREADTCIVMVGLIQVNPHTVVVVDAGAPVLMPWRDDVAAVLVVWFPGQSSARPSRTSCSASPSPAAACPAPGRIGKPTCPCSAHARSRASWSSAEGLHVGHRAWLRAEIAPAYPFGHGLGYTAWSYMHLDAPAIIAADAGATVAVRVRNEGSRPGKEVVQVYLSRTESSVDRPGRWLAGFAVVRAGPGSAVVATVHLGPRAFQHWSAPDQGWATEPGVFRALAGRSVTDLRLAADIIIERPTSTERGT